MIEDGGTAPKPQTNACRRKQSRHPGKAPAVIALVCRCSHDLDASHVARRPRNRGTPAPRGPADFGFAALMADPLLHGQGVTLNLKSVDIDS